LLERVKLLDRHRTCFAQQVIGLGSALHCDALPGDHPRNDATAFFITELLKSTLERNQFKFTLTRINQELWGPNDEIDHRSDEWQEDGQHERNRSKRGALRSTTDILVRPPDERQPQKYEKDLEPETHRAPEAGIKKTGHAREGVAVSKMWHPSSFRKGAARA
jgi:hypothetical protein